MNGFLLWATLGLVSFVPAIDGGQTGGCPECDCCMCCQTGDCKCTTCTCECCVDDCPAAGVKADRESCGSSGCCGK